MAEQSDVTFQPVIPYEQPETLPLRPFAGDGALEVESSVAQSSASPDQECVIFHCVQAAYGQQGEAALRGGGRTPRYICGQKRVDSQARHDDFPRIYPGEMIENVASVVFRNGYAVSAILKFRVEIEGMQQKVRTVQGKAETYSQ